MASYEIQYKPEMIYVCQECATKFLFIEEIASHSEMFSHFQITELPLV